MTVAVAPESPLPAPADGAAPRPNPRAAMWWAAPLIAAHLPLVCAYYARLWSLPHYQFFPLALLGAFLLARREAAAADVGVAGSFSYTGLWLAGGTVVLTAAVLFETPWLAMVAALFNAGPLIAVYRPLPRRALLSSLAMVAVTLRPPLNLDLRLIKALQAVTARCASATLDAFGVTHALTGNVIEIPGRRLLVEEACSGVNSLFSSAACLLFYVLWFRVGVVRSLLLFASVPLWVVVANALRVASVTALCSANIAADEGFLHEVLGYAAFFLAIGLILSTERLFQFYAVLIKRRDEGDVSPIAPPQSQAAPRPQLSAGARRLAGIAGLLLLLAQLPMLVADADDFRRDTAPVAQLGERRMPEAIGSWRRTNYETVRRSRSSPFGRYSEIWSFESPTGRVTASFDYPFVGWHELTECYEAQGWRVESRSITAGSADAPLAVELAMRHDATGRFGRLYFGLMVRDGAAYPVRRRGEIDEWLDRAEERWSALSAGPWAARRATNDDLTYQFQLLAESYTPLGDADVHEVRRMFDDLYARARVPFAEAAAAR